MLKKRAEEWLLGNSDRGYVHYDKALGVVSIYPDEFFAVERSTTTTSGTATGSAPPPRSRCATRPGSPKDRGAA
jgi:hypothetical protein